jgi:hypothetical protein
VSLGAAIHAYLLLAAKAWMAGPSPAKTKRDRTSHFRKGLASGRRSSPASVISRTLDEV